MKGIWHETLFCSLVYYSMNPLPRRKEEQNTGTWAGWTEQYDTTALALGIARLYRAFFFGYVIPYTHTFFFFSWVSLFMMCRNAAGIFGSKCSSPFLVMQLYGAWMSLGNRRLPGNLCV